MFCGRLVIVKYPNSLVKDIINLDAGPSRRHENFRREGHLVAIGVRERETSGNHRSKRDRDCFPLPYSYSHQMSFSAKIFMSSARHRIWVYNIFGLVVKIIKTPEFSTLEC